MEMLLNNNTISNSENKKELKQMAKVVIATLYAQEPVMLSVTKFGAERLILLIDKVPDKKQEKALETIKASLKGVVEVKTIKTSVYDIVGVSEKCIDIFDTLSDSDVVYANISAGRKTKSLGLLFACYKRINRVNKIIYITEENKEVVELPKLSFDINSSQQKVLDLIHIGKYKTPKEMSKQIDISSAMLYRSITELINRGFVKENKGYELTDAGKIARL